MKTDSIRYERLAKLISSDWTQLPDAPLTEAEKSKWAEYRQALRDLPENYPDGDKAIWPIPPSPDGV